MMITVQETLKLLDKEKLIDEYYNKIKDDIFELKDKTITLEEFEKITKKKISNFINRLIKMKPVKNKENDRKILLAYNVYDNDLFIPELSVSLIHETELKKNKLEVEPYAYYYQPQNEIIAFVIADNEFTQKNIYDVMVDIMYETSFFGYEDEMKEEVNAELNETIEQIKSGDFETRSWDEVKKDLHIEDSKDETEEDMIHQALDIIINCNKYLYEKEIKLLLESL